ncbi:unnamed protein product [Cunninghamella blakesleeana]
MSTNDTTSTLSIFGRLLDQDPLNYIQQIDNQTVVITPRYNTTGKVQLKVGVLLPFGIRNDNFTEQIVWGGSSAIRMAVNKINAEEQIPGAYITLIEKDSFPYVKVTQAAITNTVYALVTLLQQGVIGVIGDVASSWTALSALMTSTLEIPQCSFASSSISFSDKTQFKYFFRTIVTNVVTVDAIFQFIAREEWQKVGVIYSDDNLGQLLFQRTKQLSESSNIQLLNSQSFPSITSTSDLTSSADTIRDNLRLLSQSGARVIIVAATNTNQINLMLQAAYLNLLNDEYVWLVLDETITSISSYIEDYNKNVTLPSQTISLDTTFNGVIWFENWLDLKGYPPFEQFISEWETMDPSVYPFSGVPNIANNEGLAYSCMMMLAGGFKQLTQESTNYTDSLSQLATGDLGRHLTPTAFNTGYVGPEGPMKLDDNGDITSGNYRIMNYQHGNETFIGQILAGDLSMHSYPMFHDGTFNRPSDSPPSFLLNPTVNSAIAYVIYIVSAIGLLFAIGTFTTVVMYRKNDVFKAASPLFCCLQLIGFMFCYVSVILMVDIPTNITCNMTPFSFNFGFVLVLSNMIAKNYRIYRIFNNVFITKTVIKDVQLIKSVTVMVGIDMILLVAGLLIVKPIPTKIDVSLSNYYWSCESSTSNSTLPKIFFGLSVAYGILLVGFATFLAIKTRSAGKQYHRFNECRQMGLSVYNILFSSIIGLIIFANPTADYYTKYYINVVTILWATTFSLFILYLPKIQAFLQIKRKEEQEQGKQSIASQFFMAAAGVAGLGNQDQRSNHQQHRSRHEDDIGELLSIEEMLGSDAPVLQHQQHQHQQQKLNSSNVIINNNSNIGIQFDQIGNNNGSFIEVHEADVPARKCFRYFPFLSQWDMLHIMVFPWLGYFSYIPKNAKQGMVMTYTHSTIHTAELDNYVLKIHGQGAHDMYIQVPTLKELELWNKRLNQKHNITPSECSFLVKDAIQSKNSQHHLMEDGDPPSKKLNQHDDRHYIEEHDHPLSTFTSSSTQLHHRDHDHDKSIIITKKKDSTSEATISNSLHHLNQQLEEENNDHHQNENDKENNNNMHQRCSSLHSNTSSSPHSNHFS